MKRPRKRTTILIAMFLATLIYLGYIWWWSFQQYEESLNRYPESIKLYIDYFYLDSPYAKSALISTLILLFAWGFMAMVVAQNKS
jgi:hypothetical protein